MELGNWLISSPNSNVKFWSNNNGEVLAQYEDENIAEFKLSANPKSSITITSYSCKLSIDRARNSLDVIPIIKSKE